MRVLLALLLLANLGYFALTRGWLESLAGLSVQHEREPQRLAAQLNAASVRVLDANVASAALAAAKDKTACLQAGPYAAAQIDAAEAALTALQLSAGDWQRVRGGNPGSGPNAAAPEGDQWWLRVESADAAMRARLARLPQTLPGAGFQPCP